MGRRIEIYTDGACSGNPGKGGYGILLRDPEKNREKMLSQGFVKTTNNRMELLAVIVALQQIKSVGFDIHIYTDSKYVSDAVNQKWIYGWIKKGFKNVKNPDLWRLFVPLYRKYQPTFHWIKGHAGHRENEVCDQMAVKATQGEYLLRDVYFEENANSSGLF